MTAAASIVKASGEFPLEDHTRPKTPVARQFEQINETLDQLKVHNDNYTLTIWLIDVAKGQVDTLRRMLDVVKEV